MKPGTAANNAPTIPPAIEQKATVLQTGAPPAENTMSETSPKIHSPIGKPTSIGCIGWFLMLAGLDMFIPLFPFLFVTFEWIARVVPRQRAATPDLQVRFSKSGTPCKAVPLI